MKNNLAIPTAIIIAGLIIGGAVYFSGKYNSVPEPDDQAAAEETQEQTIKAFAVRINDHILGNPKAEISYFIYTDLECPFCRNFHSTIRQIAEDYAKQGKLKIIFKHFPLSSIHPNAEKFAESAECAAEIGGESKFWDYVDKLVELNINEVSKVAEEVGLDKLSFEECLNSGKYAQKVAQDFEDGVNAGVQGTPHSIIVKSDQSYPISGALPYILEDIQFFQMLNKNQKDFMCLKDTQICGIKIAIDNLLSI